MSSSPPSLRPLLRQEYCNDHAIAIVGRYERHPTHPSHLIRLAHLYEDEDEPASQLTKEHIPELVSVFRETATKYAREGLYDVIPFLRSEADYLQQRFEAMQVLSEDAESVGCNEQQGGELKRCHSSAASTSELLSLDPPVRRLCGEPSHLSRPSHNAHRQRIVV